MQIVSEMLFLIKEKRVKMQKHPLGFESVAKTPFQFFSITP